MRDNRGAIVLLWRVVSDYPWSVESIFPLSSSAGVLMRPPTAAESIAEWIGTFLLRGVVWRGMAWYGWAWQG